MTRYCTGQGFLTKLQKGTAYQDIFASYQPSRTPLGMLCRKSVPQNEEGEIILSEALFHILSQNASHRELTNLNFLTVSLPLQQLLTKPDPDLCILMLLPSLKVLMEQGSWSTSDGKTKQAWKESVDSGGS